MPYAEGSDFRVHYEHRGSGTDLLLLNHIGASGLGWRREFLADLERSFRLIVLDQRGTGSSEKPDSPYELADLARDALAVMDAANVSLTHVLGLSMGGAVAQELVLAAPERIHGLVLVSTFCGPRKSISPDPDVLKLFELVPGASRRDHILQTLPAYHSKGFVERNAELLITLTERGSKDTPLHTIVRQSEAVKHFDSYDRLPAIRTPTLVVHGEADPIIPCENAHILRARIPNAQLVVVPEVGHVPMTERPHEIADHVSSFLLPLSPPPH